MVESIRLNSIRFKMSLASAKARTLYILFMSWKLADLLIEQVNQSLMGPDESKVNSTFSSINLIGMGSIAV